MEFTRIAGPEEMEVWKASSNAVSFVISYGSRNGPGLHGQTGFAVSWRPIAENRPAVGVGGSPFRTLAEAKEACNAMASVLMDAGRMGGRVNFDARAVLRKWPSLRNERSAGALDPYLIMDHSLGECLQQFMAKPISVRHLYEIHIVPKPPFAKAVLPEGLILEFARLRGLDS
ncbi:hypothetical protein JQ628_34020 [Bradyrhizobium lablabi]|uniref:hypothetical protein n=1 Tax=Bradyrhizobium lablabi TaxID=722472 RepID=UPI001BA90F2D|nr:hypothetical protein [Bradyrhizobium lablabi]MBR1126578.1 hypothetical protein [Bradyrhizobium lablabi]